MKDPVKRMRIFVGVRDAIQRYREEHNVGVGAAFALFGDDPMHCARLMSNPARSDADETRMRELIEALKTRGLDLSQIVPVSRTVTA